MKHFVVHKHNSKIEVCDQQQPGVLAYSYDETNVRPRDLSAMLEAAQAVLPHPNLEEEGVDPVKYVMKPLDGSYKKVDIYMDIRNRSDIHIGTMVLWRYG